MGSTYGKIYGGADVPTPLFFFREVLAQTQMSLYDVLLVDQNATLEEIKLAFKRRALQVHPDKGGSKEEFHLVYQARLKLWVPTQLRARSTITP